MLRSHLGAAAISAAFSYATVALAQSAAGFVPAVPGTIVQRQAAYLTGAAPGGQWSAVASKTLVGSGSGQSFYQWYLSIYAPRRGAYRLRYQSPKNGGPLERVTQASGAKMWFPVQRLRIVGAAGLMGHSTQQLVVQSHEMAADCGGSMVTVFASGPGDAVVRAASVTNQCELDAKIGADGASIVLTGPYYNATAPMCCPTKNAASAVLRYRGGKWVESPDYFKLN